MRETCKRCGQSAYGCKRSGVCGVKKLKTWTDEVTGALVVRMPGRDDAHGRAVCVVTTEGSSNFWEHLEGGKQLAPIAARYYAAHPEVVS